MKLNSVTRTALCVALLVASIAGIFASRCVDDRCNCRHISGKRFAMCDGLNLRALPSCSEASREEENSLASIKAMNISGNTFKELTEEFFHRACLTNLQKIYIQQAYVERIHNEAFYPLTNVIELSLAKNQLRYVPSRALENLQLLRNLDLSGNNIDNLQNGSFSTLRSLRQLALDGNRISHIDADAFKGLVAIETIRLNDNRLTILRPEMFVPLVGLHTLFLENNEWNCNCKMQPFKRMLLIKTHLTIQDNPICGSTSASLTSSDLDNFQCAPQILLNYSDTQVAVSEDSTLRLRCATFVESFGDTTADSNYFSHTKIEWGWNGATITNGSRGVDELANLQHFIVEEHVGDLNDRTKVKISNLELNSVIALNAGNYFCNVQNNAGSDSLKFQVRVMTRAVPSGDYDSSRNIVPAASSSMSLPSNAINSNNQFTRVKVISGDADGDHILFGLVFGILCGIFIVLVIFSIILVVFFRRQKEPINELRHPHELAIVDSGSNDDNHTFDEANESTSNTTVDKMAMVGADFNPLLVNPVQKPPRLGIPDVSSLYSHPSWTLDRNNGFGNRSRYASYAETEPLYSDYYTIYRPNRQMAKIDENRTFISDTASEV